MNKLTRTRPRKSVLSDFYVFDVETGIRENGGIQWHLNARPESFIFGVIHGRNYTKVIHDLKEFHETLLEPRFKKRKVFAHNATYDLGTLYGNIFHLDAEAIFAGSRFISATNGNCTFADSMNIYKTSVKNLGKMIGKAKPDLGDESMFSKEVGPDEINRCIVDCEIVWEVLHQIFEDVGSIKITQASLSMAYFLSKHIPFTIEHDETKTKYFWDSYYGGRTEAFKIGPTHSNVIDVNSMYPDRMKWEQFPNPKFLKVETSDKLNAKHFINRFLNIILPNYEGCIYARVTHAPNWFGLLPVKKDGKLLFPVGSITGVWNFNEFRFAIQTGLVTINAIDRIVYGERLSSPFIDYVDTLYKARFATINPIEIYRIKIFMNSLYGKFAQRIDRETVYIADIQVCYNVIEDYQKKGLLIKIMLFNSERRDAFLIVKSTRQIDLNYSIPSFASYITSGARVMLAKKLFEMQNNRVTYCDTDSIFYEIDSPNIKTGSKLGEWKKENKTVTEIRGLKNYKYIDHDKGQKEISRIKGVPDKAIQTAPGRYEYSNLLNTKEALRRNLPAGVLTKRTKVITGKYDKRVIFANGETEPICL